MAQQAPRHGVVAVDDDSVETHGLARVLQRIAQGRVASGGEPRHGGLPHLRQAARVAGGGRPTDVALDVQQLLAHRLAGRAGGRLVADQLVDQVGQRARERPARRGPFDQHQRKVVAQPRQVTVAGQQRRSQAQLADRLERRGGLAAGQVEGGLGL